MEKHLFLRINEKKSKMSKGQKLIANYILENYDKAAFMTASKLGDRVGVSESTVVRFATEVGYEGYPKLQKAMQEMIRDKLTSVQRIDVTANRISQDDVLNTVLNQDIEKIKMTLEETSRDDFDNAVNAIVKAKNIYLFAVRSSSALANFFGYYLDQIFGNVHVISTTSKIEIYEKLIHINSSDLIIGISFPRYSNTAVEAMKFASDRKASVIALTDSMISPLVAPADYVLLARSDMASVVDSLVAPLSMINALLVATVLKKKESVKETFRQLEDVWDKYDVYAKTSEIAQGKELLNAQGEAERG
ncbi:MAG: MurR/RpiR family transcriptional regulator [Acutalibacteraceae bacterium]